MRVTRISLRNYRVYPELDLDVPAGVVGIYGVNGAGKSALVESILFALYGKSRTKKNADVRTTGVNAECVAEVEFEHEGHLYSVRRTISGENAAVKAQATADGKQVAEGVTDTTRYVRSVLGMDDAAFRASVFAEQKQLAAFSAQQPEKRRQLVLELLGISPLDKAKDNVRAEARAARDVFDRQREMVPEVEPLRATAEAATGAAAEWATEAEQASVAEAAARQVLDEARSNLETLEDRGRQHKALVDDGRQVAAARDAAARRVEEVGAELAGLDAAEAALAGLAAEADPLEALDARWRAAQELVRADAELAAVPAPEPVGAPEPALAEKAAAAVEAARVAAADVEGELRATEVAVVAAQAAAAAGADLSTQATCPLCGQELGDAFERVRAHHVEEARGAVARRDRLAATRQRLHGELDSLEMEAKAAARALDADREAYRRFEQTTTRRQGLEDAAARARAALTPPLRDGEAQELAAAVARARRASQERDRLLGRLERRPASAAELERATADRTAAESRRQELLAEVAALGFDADALNAARASTATAEVGLEQAVKTAREAELRAASGKVAAEQAAARFADAEGQHAKLESVREDARHLSRVAELLGSFRNTLVGVVGPKLEAHAGALFDELTDHAYEGIVVDPETYEIRIRDAGVIHGMERFSGSEVDLANLALRVAISEHVRFVSGGQVGLLVLDEVFGSLDDDRRARLLAALERLRGRFRQILVITHSTDIKEQLPQALEVATVGERRAMVRSLV